MGRKDDDDALSTLSTRMKDFDDRKNYTAEYLAKEHKAERRRKRKEEKKKKNEFKALPIVDSYYDKVRDMQQGEMPETIKYVFPKGTRTHTFLTRLWVLATQVVKITISVLLIYFVSAFLYLMYTIFDVARYMFNDPWAAVKYAARGAFRPFNARGEIRNFENELKEEERKHAESNPPPPTNNGGGGGGGDTIYDTLAKEVDSTTKCQKTRFGVMSVALVLGAMFGVVFARVFPTANFGRYRARWVVAGVIAGLGLAVSMKGVAEKLTEVCIWGKDNDVELVMSFVFFLFGFEIFSLDRRNANAPILALVFKLVALVFLIPTAFLVAKRRPVGAVPAGFAALGAAVISHYLATNNHEKMRDLLGRIERLDPALDHGTISQEILNARERGWHKPGVYAAMERLADTNNAKIRSFLGSVKTGVIH